MRLVWLSHFVPYPPRGGSFQRTFNLLRHISRKYETTFVALNLLGEPRERLTQYKEEFKKYCAEVEFWETPFRWRGARWWTQLALSPLYSCHYAARSLWSPQLDARWRALLEKHRGGLVNFETIDLALYFPASEGFRRVLNHQNCESAMAERRAANESNPLKRVFLLHQARKIARLERTWCPRFDVNVAVSDLDADLLRSRSPGAHFHVVENGTDTEYFHPSDTEPEPKSIVFAASLRWYPNVSGILYFGRDIWPLIKKECPDARLYLAGRQPSPSIMQWARKDPNITVVASPEDIRPWLARAAVVICPIIDGGGTRLKILDALAMGKAVVSTAIGSEGLNVRRNEHILIGDTPSDFAAHVLRLLGDQDLRRALGSAGREFVVRNHSWEVVGERLEMACLRAQGDGLCPHQVGSQLN